MNDPQAELLDLRGVRRVTRRAHHYSNAECDVQFLETPVATGTLSASRGGVGRRHAGGLCRDALARLRGRGTRSTGADLKIRRANARA